VVELPIRAPSEVTGPSTVNTEKKSVFENLGPGGKPHTIVTLPLPGVDDNNAGGPQLGTQLAIF
jgi:hypothetical protein